VTTRSRTIVLLALLLLPFSVSAKQETVWSFVDSVNPPGDWEGKGLDSAQMTDVGLLVQTEHEGQLARDTKWAHGVDTLRVTYASETPTTMQFRWHARGTPPSHMVVLPVGLEQTSIPLTLDLDLTQFDQWDRHTPRVALAFEPGATVVVRALAFTGYNVFEKARTAWSSLWEFDDLRAYSINFLWGPQMTYNPIARAEIFRHFPPLGNSFNWVAYAVLAVLLAVLFVRYCLAHRNMGAVRREIAAICAIFAVFWVFLDVRMGLEIMKYLRDDYVAYFSQPPERKEFRDRGHFHTFVGSVDPLLKAERRYVFLAPSAWPFLGLIRYLTYPSLPTMPGEGQKDVRTWVVFERPDIAVNADGRLTEDGNPISLPGEVIHEFEPGTFLFRTN